ncbi:bile salt-activated lipase [Aplysia californica]|uniref:Carboxylic ester hydrolase n=1 Tax=Aplysia californica TaxID=6500 RepID=A0ABM1VXF8_APLCA|nr:bile salt-activated lipase [Aplysia californica]
MSEDCLKLNVYVPGNASTHSHASKAVMLWLYGGAYLIGQSRIYNAERLAAFGDVIVVTANYRVGAFGFLSTGDGVLPGNAGLWDQQAAIAWVYENIADFGGDRNNITLFGESAGGASSTFQLLNPQNKGKIRRVIASSGTFACPWAFNDNSMTSARTFSMRLANRLGCSADRYPGFSVEGHKKILKCLRSRPMTSIIKNSLVSSLEETLFRADWVPSLDGHFIKRDVLSLFKLSSANLDSAGRNVHNFILNDTLLGDVDVMIGSNYDDGEVIVKTTAQLYLSGKTGLNLDDPNLTYEEVSKYYVTKILQDIYGVYNPLPKLEDLFRNVYVSKNMSLASVPDAVVHAVLDMTTDFEFFIPALQTLSNIATVSVHSERKMYMWQFDRKYPYLSRPHWVQHASHGDDLPYVFGFPQSMSEAFNITQAVQKAEWSTARNIMTFWSNFAKSG